MPMKRTKTKGRGKETRYAENLNQFLRLKKKIITNVLKNKFNNVKSTKFGKVQKRVLNK